MHYTGRVRTTCVEVRPALPSDIPEIVDLWRRHGEGNVDIRDTTAVEAAVHSGGLHCFVVSKEIIGTGGFYPYENAVYTELGSSCWLPSYRGRGGALLSVSFRAVYASIVEMGTLIVSELYDSSKKSFKLLDRLQFVEQVAVPSAMHAHAYAANPIDPVRHMVLSPWLIPACARSLRHALNGGGIDGGDLTFAFAPNYGFEHAGVKSQIEQLAAGDVTMIGHHKEAPTDLQAWMALRAMDGLIDYRQFLDRIRANPSVRSS